MICILVFQGYWNKKIIDEFWVSNVRYFCCLNRNSWNPHKPSRGCLTQTLHTRVLQKKLFVTASSNLTTIQSIFRFWRWALRTPPGTTSTTSCKSRGMFYIVRATLGTRWTSWPRSAQTDGSKSLKRREPGIDRVPCPKFRTRESFCSTVSRLVVHNCDCVRIFNLIKWNLNFNTFYA